MTDPTAFLARSASELFIYGWIDCATWVGSWAEECCGVNPTAAWRNRYKTAIGCARVLKREGGLGALTMRMADSFGFPTVASPEPGTIGLLDTKEAGPTLSIMAMTGRWVCKGYPMGVAFPGGDVLMMWSPVCRR